MNRLESLRSKKITKKINDVEFTFSSLTFTELTELSLLSDKKEHQKVLEFILFTGLRKAITKEEVSDEELKLFIDDMDSKAALEIVKTIQELSGLLGEEKKSQIEVVPMMMVENQ